MRLALKVTLTQGANAIAAHLDATALFLSDSVMELPGSSGNAAGGAGAVQTRT